MRNSANWQVYTATAQPAPMFGRGYTGHEHLNQFGLINMNARLYDPLLARFLAPDPFVGSGMTNDFNRYIYCLNNPLMFTDPSGKSIWSFLKRQWNNFSNFMSRTFPNGFEIGYGQGMPGSNSRGFFYNGNLNGGSSFGGNYNKGTFTTTSSYQGYTSSSFNPTQAVVQAEQNARSEYYNLKSMASNYGTQISDWVENHIFMESEFRVDKGYQAAANVTVAGFDVGFDVQKDTSPLCQLGFEYNKGFSGSVYANSPTDYGILKEPLRNSWSVGGFLGTSKTYDSSSSFFSWGQMQTENINAGVVNVTNSFDYTTRNCYERQFSLDLKFDLSLLFGIHGKFRFGYK